MATVDPLDLRSLAAAIAEVLDCWRALQFDGGLVVVGGPGERREGLRVLAGTHPVAGTSYRVSLVEPVSPELTAEEQAELARIGGREPEVAEWLRRRTARLEASGQRRTKTTTIVVDVREDTAAAMGLCLVLSDPSPVNVDLVLDRPRAPKGLSASVGGRIEGNWLMRGPVHGGGALSLDPLPQLELNVRHRRARGAAAVHTRLRDDGRWDVTFNVRARGAGLLRPFAATVTPWLATKARQRVQAVVAALPERVSQFNGRWRAEVAQHGERGIAQRWVDEFLEALR